MPAGMVAAASPNFGSELPLAAPGDAVPTDCVWSQHPYPGPVTGRLRGSAPRRLEAIGVVTGRPRSEIVRLVGAATETRQMGSGDLCVTWSAKTFWSSETLMVTLRFDRHGVCRGVQDQHRARSGSSGVGVGVGVIVPMDGI